MKDWNFLDIEVLEFLELLGLEVFNVLSFKVLTSFESFQKLKKQGKSYAYLYTWVYIAEIVYLQVYIFGYVYL